MQAREEKEICCCVEMMAGREGLNHRDDKQGNRGESGTPKRGGICQSFEVTREKSKGAMRRYAFGDGTGGTSPGMKTWGWRV